MKEKTFEFTDRYKAIGIPDPETCCDGLCEGTGFVPINESETDPIYKALWDEAHKKCSFTFRQRISRFFRDWRKVIKYGIRIHWDVCFSKCDGWHFVKCPDCNGTGKKLGKSNNEKTNHN